jgi:hypothetical protein
VGDLGQWHPILDWGFADYKFKDWLGVRGGKVKTTLGLFNDSQDQESLHTWAMLPQSVYALDLRGNTIAHNGVDVYGRIPLKRLGNLEYTVYGGARVFDPYGGYSYSLHTMFSAGKSEFNVKSQTGEVIGEDLRWNTPLKGLLVGASHAGYSYVNHSEGDAGNMFQGYSSARAAKNYSTAFYFDYSAGSLRLYGEYQRYWEDYKISVGSAEHPINLGGNTPNDQRMGYLAVSYRISKRLELGTYHSRFIGSWSSVHSAPSNHLFDQTMTARVDLNSHWDVKVEGHLMDGAPSPTYLHGYYSSVNPNGLSPTSKMFVVRTGWAF